MIFRNRSLALFDYILLPLLFVASLDLSQKNSSYLFLFTLICTVLTRDFLISILRFWQATAVLASLLWGLSKCFGINFNITIVFNLAILLWFVLCHFGKSSAIEKFKIQEKLCLRLSLFCFFVFVFLLSPHNFPAKFSMLEAEDQENWMQPVVETRRDNVLNFDIPLGSQGVQFFTRTILAIFSKVVKYDGDNFIGLDALEVVSTVWIFSLLSALVILSIILLLISGTQFTSSKFFCLCFICGFFLIIFFRVSLFPGHLSQFLLTVTAYGFVASLLMRNSHLKQKNLAIERFVSFACALSLLGSYNPWLPITIVAIIIASISEIQATSLPKLAAHYRFWVLMTFLTFIVVFNFQSIVKKFPGLHDGGGVLQVSNLAILFASLTVLVATGCYLVSFFNQSVQFENRRNTDYLWIWSLISVLLLSLVFFENVTSLSLTINHETTMLFDQLRYISLFCIAGYLFLPSSLRFLLRLFSYENKRSPNWSIALFFILSFLFVILVWFLSVFTGIRKPMYASQKSALSFFSQFFWLAILLFFLRAKVLNGFRASMHLLLVILLFIFGLGLMPMTRQVVLAKSFSDPQIFYDSWWFDDVSFVLRENPSAMVVCVSPSLPDPDLSVYTCNRFLQTLTDFVYPASGFRYLAWYQPDEFNKIQNFYDTTPVTVEVIVLSQSELSEEIKSIFRNVDTKNINYIVNNSYG